MILRFKHNGLKRLYQDNDRSRLPAQYADKIARVLADLDDATEYSALNKPGYKLHSLKGYMSGYWSITISPNWRVIFCFDGEDVTNVDFLDYH